MADPIQVANSASQLDGKTLLTAEDAQVVAGGKVFNRAPSAPFEIESGSALVTNLDADKLDGEHGSDFHNASNLNTGTLPAARFPAALPAVSGENLTNLNAANLSGVVPESAVPDPLPAVSGANLTALPNPLPAVSGANLTALPNPLPAVSGANLTALPNPLPASSAQNLTKLMTLLQGFAYSSGQGNGNGPSDTHLTSYDKTIDAAYLAQPGDGLLVFGTFVLVANTNTKTMKLKVGGGTLMTVFATAASVSNQIVPFLLVIRRRTSTTGSLTGISWINAADQGAPAAYLVNTVLGTVDWTIDQVLEVYAATSASGSGANDIRLTDYTLLPFRGVSGITV